MATIFDSRGVGNCHFLARGGAGSLYKFKIVIPKTPLYKGMGVWYRYLFCSFSIVHKKKRLLETGQ